MTTDADLRAYLDAHGTDGAPAAVDFGRDGDLCVLLLDYADEAVAGFGYAAGPGVVKMVYGPITGTVNRNRALRHAPLRLAAPDLGCGHPAACVRPKTGHAGTTRWCGWCEAEAGREHNAGRVIAEQDRRERAERERDAAIAEVARLAPDEDRQWARDLLARLEPTGGYDEEDGR